MFERLRVGMGVEVAFCLQCTMVWGYGLLSLGVLHVEDGQGWWIVL